MMRVDETFAGFARALPAIFNSADAGFVEAEGAANAFGIAFDSRLPPDQGDKANCRNGDGEQRNPLLHSQPDEGDNRDNGEQTPVTQPVSPGIELLQPNCFLRETFGIDTAWCRGGHQRKLSEPAWKLALAAVLHQELRMANGNGWREYWKQAGCEERRRWGDSRGCVSNVLAGFGTGSDSLGVSWGVSGFVLPKGCLPILRTGRNGAVRRMKVRPASRVRGFWLEVSIRPGAVGQRPQWC